MAYADHIDITNHIDEKILTELTDDSNEGYPDQSILQWALDTATAELDSFFSASGKYTSLPLKNFPDIVKVYCSDIAIYVLYGRRNTIPEYRQLRYESAIEWARQVAEGSVDIQGMETSGQSSFSANPQIFGKKNMIGM